LKEQIPLDDLIKFQFLATALTLPMVVSDLAAMLWLVHSAERLINKILLCCQTEFLAIRQKFAKKVT
jgi:hypothetical protein